MIDSVEFTEAAPSLLVELESVAGTCRLTLRGALCGTSIAALEAQVDQLGCTQCDEVIIDMQHLTALDPVGANVILGLYHYVVGRGGELRVTSARADVSATLHAIAGGLIQIGAYEQAAPTERSSAVSSCASDMVERPGMPRRRASP
jgi:anti-anti-sigma factor